MPKFKHGDRVRIVTRAVTPDDARTSLYFAHYAGLPGVVSHVYSDGEAAIEVPPEALPADVRSRQNAIRHQMKTKWLEGLSEEGRSRLTEREKDFRLRYVVLVSVSDLEEDTAPPPVPVSEQPEISEADSELDERATKEDLNRAEEEELLRRRHSQT